MKPMIPLGPLALGAALALLPVTRMVAVSFKPQPEVFTLSIAPLPKAPRLANHRLALIRTEIPRYLINGVVVTDGILVLQLPVSAPCAYPLAHLRFSGNGPLFAALPAPLHVAAILSVTAHRDDQFWPMIAASDPQIATPPRGILFFLDADNGDDVGPLMAGAVQAIAPLVLGFLLAQRPVTQGLANIGLKG